MKKVYESNKDDADVATLYAESMMDLLPWNLFDGKGQPRPETPEIIAVLEHALAIDAKHPGATHLYIHAMEASPTPEKALAAAEVLRTQVPISGHLVHMPAHIDVRVGRWDRAIEQNRAALAADAKYRAISPHQGFYRIYMAHNDHFLSWAAMMEGRSNDAITHAKAMSAKMPGDFVREWAVAIDGYTPIDIDALIRFGRWDDLLALEKPPAYLPIRTVMWHFGRGTAFAAKGDTEKANAELAAMREGIRALPAEQIMTLNPAQQVLSIGEHTLAGEIAYRSGKTDEAVAELTKAVEIEDTLRYIEPPDWIQPARHTLGAVLLAAGRTDDAEKVYRTDLEHWPENGWALHGLGEALARKKSPEAAEVKARFEKAWARADTPIHATCLCIDKDASQGKGG
jgi:tetratricopeptide (TPR) repeat protein